MTGNVRHWAVADGREALGIVKLDGEKFVAVDVAGRDLGKFATLLEASRAFITTTEMNTGTGERRTKSFAQ